MTRCILIPVEQQSPLVRVDLDSLADYWMVISGWIEAIRFPAEDLILYVDEGGKQLHRPINYRATWLFWWLKPETYRLDFIVGDAVLAGYTEGAEDDSDVPELFASLLLEAGGFRVEARGSSDADEWTRINGVFTDYFEAASHAATLLHHWNRPQEVRIVAERA